MELYGVFRPLNKYNPLEAACRAFQPSPAPGLLPAVCRLSLSLSILLFRSVCLALDELCWCLNSIECFLSQVALFR